MRVKSRPRILFVAMAQSVHTARWIEQLVRSGHDVHVFPAQHPGDVHSALTGVTLHGVGLWRPAGLDPSVAVGGLWPFRKGAFRAQGWLERWAPRRLERAAQLARVIQKVRPDCVHSLEMQQAGYLVLEARRRLGGRMPPWIYSSWGSDLYHFGQQPEHRDRVREVLGACDYYIADCERDVELARQMGLKGKVLGVFPGVGGFDIAGMVPFRQVGPVSARRVIAVKGYQHWVGRALLALQAVQRCEDVLHGYEIIVYSATFGVPEVVAHMAATSRLNIRVLPASPHEELLKLLGRSRLAIGVSVSDGTPNAMLEAMVMGALPVQSDTGSTAEWIQDGVNGLLVPPEDPVAIERAVRRAIIDDMLVDAAAAENARITVKRIDRDQVEPRVLEAYARVCFGAGYRRRP